MTDTHVMALPSPLTNIHQYQTLVETFPRLGEEEERALAEQFRSSHDLHAAWRLVTSHLRYVVYIARSYQGYGLPLEDLVQEGNVGLMKAVRRFDASRGVRLVAYASYWIRAHIHEFILKNWRIVKVATTKAKRKLFYKLRGAKQRLEWLSRAEAEEIGQTLDVSADEVLDMEGRLYLGDESFDAPPNHSDEEWAPAAYLQDSRFEPAEAVANDEFLALGTAALTETLGELDARSRDILESRWLADDAERLTLQQLGERYGVSAERIRQLETAAMKRLRDAVTARIGADAQMM